ncbi:MAG: PAS domain S-box protein, partial [Bacteroidota bacterium]
MNYQNKTKEELIKELQEVQQKYGSLNATFEKEKIILAKLINAAEEFIQFSSAAHDYTKMLQIIHDISGAKYAVLNIFDDNGLDFTTVAFAGINENIEKVSSFLGFDIVKKHWKHDPLRDEKTKQQTITRFVHLHDLVGDIISKSAIYLIEKTFSLGETFVVKIVKENKTLGDFTLLFNKGETLINNEFVDLYAHQVGLFLDRYSATNLLRVNEARHGAMISNISDVIGIIGTDGIMKYKSPNIEKWFGWQPHDLVGTDGWLTVHPDDLERIQKEFFTLLEKDNSVKTVEYRYKCKNGSYKPIELTATNLTNDPIIGGVLLNYHDITERKRAEENLRYSEAQLQMIANNFPDGIIVLYDQASRYIFAEGLGLEDIGFTKEMLLGKRPQDLFPPEFSEVMEQKIDNAFKGKKETFEINLGEQYFIQTVTPVKNINTQIAAVMGVITNISNRKRMEDLLNQTRYNYETFFNTIDEFLFVLD